MSAGSLSTTLPVQVGLKSNNPYGSDPDRRGRGPARIEHLGLAVLRRARAGEPASAAGWAAHVWIRGVAPAGVHQACPPAGGAAADSRRGPRRSPPVVAPNRSF